VQLVATRRMRPVTCCPAGPRRGQAATPIPSCVQHGELQTGNRTVTVTASITASTAAYRSPSCRSRCSALGAKEVAFDWSTDRCEDLDVPDAGHLVRRDGSLALFDGNAPRFTSATVPDSIP